MSLTKDEWLEMWESIKRIEDRNKDAEYYSSIIDDEVRFIKDKIQSVIGQQE